MARVGLEKPPNWQTSYFLRGDGVWVGTTSELRLFTTQHDLEDEVITRIEVEEEIHHA